MRCAQAWRNSFAWMPPTSASCSHYVGGAFGSQGAPTARTAWIAVAARRIGRTVKLVATRHQSYTIATYRAETRHRIQLGAARDGRLQALRHEGWELTSRPSKYNVSRHGDHGRLYGCSNIRTKVNIVHADRNTPASCARRRRCRTCSRWKRRWTSLP